MLWLEFQELKCHKSYELDAKCRLFILGTLAQRAHRTRKCTAETLRRLVLCHMALRVPYSMPDPRGFRR